MLTVTYQRIPAKLYIIQLSEIPLQDVAQFELRGLKGILD